VICSILPEALQEAIEAAAWYDSSRAGLGDEFHSEFRNVIQRIQVNPLVHCKLEGYDGQNNIRRCTFKRFPYLVIFELSNDEISIIAVAHARRKPFFWTGRLP
jgi:toxin ParE1/3/4